MIYRELIRLGALLAAAQASPLSCPRDRCILQTKIQGLEEAAERAKTLSVRAAKAIEIAQAEMERMGRNLERLRATRAGDPQPANLEELNRYVEAWEQEHIDLWEREDRWSSDAFETEWLEKKVNFSDEDAKLLFERILDAVHPEYDEITVEQSGDSKDFEETVDGAVLERRGSWEQVPLKKDPEFPTPGKYEI